MEKEEIEIRQLVAEIFPPGTDPQAVKAFIGVLAKIADPDHADAYATARLAGQAAWERTDEFHYAFENFVGKK